MNDNHKASAIVGAAAATLIGGGIATQLPAPKPPPVPSVPTVPASSPELTSAQEARIEATKAVKAASNLPEDDRVLYVNLLQQASVMLDRARNTTNRADAQRNIDLSNAIVADVKSAVR